MPSEAVRAATPLEVRGSVEGGSKLLLLVRSLEPGGAERQLVTLATGLHRRGRGVVVLAFYDRGALLEELRREPLLTDLRRRIRDVKQGRDGLLYLLTDEAEGVMLRIEPAE